MCNAFKDYFRGAPWDNIFKQGAQLLDQMLLIYGDQENQ